MQDEASAGGARNINPYEAKESTPMSAPFPGGPCPCPGLDWGARRRAVVARLPSVSRPVTGCSARLPVLRKKHSHARPGTRRASQGDRRTAGGACVAWSKRAVANATAMAGFVRFSCPARPSLGFRLLRFA